MSEAPTTTPAPRLVKREKQTEMLSFLVKKSMRDALWVAAARDGKSLSDLVRGLIAVGLAVRKNNRHGKRRK